MTIPSWRPRPPFDTEPVPEPPPPAEGSQAREG